MYQLQAVPFGVTAQIGIRLVMGREQRKGRTFYIFIGRKGGQPLNPQYTREYLNVQYSRRFTLHPKQAEKIRNQYLIDSNLVTAAV